jgi:hypothetical protein
MKYPDRNKTLNVKYHPEFYTLGKILRVVKHYKSLILISLLILAASFVQAQKQLVMLKREKVMMRFNPGDEFVISLKGEKKKMTSYINNIFDTAVMVHKTLIPLHKINKIYFKRSGLVNLIGKFLVVAGVGYFVIDQFNVVVVDGDKPSLNDNVTNASVAMVAAGLPMMLIRKKYQRVGGKFRLLTVETGSPFYLEPVDEL